MELKIKVKNKKIAKWIIIIILATGVGMPMVSCRTQLTVQQQIKSLQDTTTMTTTVRGLARR